MSSVDVNYLHEIGDEGLDLNLQSLLVSGLFLQSIKLLLQFLNLLFLFFDRSASSQLGTGSNVISRVRRRSRFRFFLNLGRVRSQSQLHFHFNLG